SQCAKQGQLSHTGSLLGHGLGSGGQEITCTLMSDDSNPIFSQRSACKVRQESRTNRQAARSRCDFPIQAVSPWQRNITWRARSRQRREAPGADPTGLASAQLHADYFRVLAQAE